MQSGLDLSATCRNNRHVLAIIVRRLRTVDASLAVYDGVWMSYRGSRIVLDAIIIRPLEYSSLKEIAPCWSLFDTD